MNINSSDSETLTAEEELSGMEIGQMDQICGRPGLEISVAMLMPSMAHSGWTSMTLLNASTLSTSEGS